MLSFCLLLLKNHILLLFIQSVLLCGFHEPTKDKTSWGSSNCGCYKKKNTWLWIFWYKIFFVEMSVKQGNVEVLQTITREEVIFHHKREKIYSKPNQAKDVKFKLFLSLNLSKHLAGMLKLKL